MWNCRIHSHVPRGTEPQVALEVSSHYSGRRNDIKQNPGEASPRQGSGNNSSREIFISMKETEKCTTTLQASDRDHNTVSCRRYGSLLYETLIPKWRSVFDAE